MGKYSETHLMRLAHCDSSLGLEEAAAVQHTWSTSGSWLAVLAYTSLFSGLLQPSHPQPDPCTPTHAHDYPVLAAMASSKYSRVYLMLRPHTYCLQLNVA